MLSLISYQLTLTLNNASNSIKEYLLYETEELITKFEINHFCEQVDALRAKSEILEQKIQLLNK